MFVCAFIFGMHACLICMFYDRFIYMVYACLIDMPKYVFMWTFLYEKKWLCDTHICFFDHVMFVIKQLNCSSALSLFINAFKSSKDTILQCMVK